MSEDSSQLKIQELISRAQKGDGSAFEIIYLQYFTPVFRYIYSKTRNKADTEDLTQIVFLKALSSISRFRLTQKEPLAYFFTIARNTVIDHWKKKKDILASDTENILLEIEDKKKSPAEAFDNSADIKKIYQAIEKLSPDQQEIIRLKFISDLSNKEIEKITKKTQASIRQIQSRAIKTLRSLIEK